MRSAARSSDVEQFHETVVIRHERMRARKVREARWVWSVAAYVASYDWRVQDFFGEPTRDFWVFVTLTPTDRPAVQGRLEAHNQRRARRS